MINRCLPKIPSFQKPRHNPTTNASQGRSRLTRSGTLPKALLAATLAACGGGPGSGEIRNPRAESFSQAINLKKAEIQLAVESTIGLGEPLAIEINEHIETIVSTLQTVDQAAVNYYNVANQNQTEGRLYFKTSMINFRSTLADAVSWIGEKTIDPSISDFVVPPVNTSNVGFYIRQQHVDYLTFFVGYQHTFSEAFLASPRSQEDQDLLRMVFPIAMQNLAAFIEFEHDLFPGTTAN